MGKPYKGTRHLGRMRMNTHRQAPDVIAARIYAAIQKEKGRHKTLVALLENGDIAYGPAHKGIVAQVLDLPTAGDLIVGTFTKASSAADIQERLQKHIDATPTQHPGDRMGDTP